MVTTLKSRINRKLLAAILPFSMAFGLAGYSLSHIQWNPNLGQQVTEPDDAATPITQHVVLNFDGLMDTQSTAEVLQ
ncbi:MAG: hypothetical protein ABSH08_20400 [Tepidisphaeraceae bacterium]|jgi:hypothetical protein